MKKNIFQSKKNALTFLEPKEQNLKGWNVRKLLFAVGEKSITETQ